MTVFQREEALKKVYTASNRWQNKDETNDIAKIVMVLLENYKSHSE